MTGMTGQENDMVGEFGFGRVKCVWVRSKVEVRGGEK